MEMFENLGQFWPLSYLVCFKELPDNKRAKITNHIAGGSWQTPPDDTMENILQRLNNLSDRIRLSVVCKSWSSTVMRRDIRGPPQFPWLLLHQHRPRYLRFFSLYDEGNVEMELPQTCQGWCFSSSKGWLIMVKEQGLDSEISLLNPISKVQHKLPSLSTIPSFQKNVRNIKDNWKSDAVGLFLLRIALSSSNISDCVVAALFKKSREVGLCRPGGKTWTLFQISDEILLDPTDVLFSSSGMLYILNNAGTKKSSIIDHTLNFGDCVVKLKMINENTKDWINNVQQEDHDDYNILLKGDYDGYLIESATNNEVLLIHRLMDVYKSNHNDKCYRSTCDFIVYKIDPDQNGNFIRVHNLGSQILFLADYGSLSLPVSDFIGLKGNCIYYRAIGILEYSAYSQKQTTGNESGIFYLDDGRIERSFQSTDTEMCGDTWFTPSL